MSDVPAMPTLPRSPAAGTVVMTNPPSFVWEPIREAVSYRLTLRATHLAGNSYTFTTDLPIFTPPIELDPAQTWEWSVEGLDRTGRVIGNVPVWTFRIAPDAVSFALPPLAEVINRVPRQHPRLFVRPDVPPDHPHSLAQLRAKRTSPLAASIWAELYDEALRLAREEPLPAEPPHCRPGGVWDVKIWREAYIQGYNLTDKLEKLAFAYLISENREIGEAARRWALTIASWPATGPEAATSAEVMDECSMPILVKLSRTFTWCYDLFTPEERRLLRQCLLVRGEDHYQLLRRHEYHIRPWDSHQGRSLGFLGEAAIALLWEPESEAEPAPSRTAVRWFDYLLRIFFAVYPAWGGEPGGWAEGNSYWRAYMDWALWFVDVLSIATGLDLYRKPFFRNTGYFKLYNQPPYSKMGPFGDFAEMPPKVQDAHVMAHLARIYRNGYFQWYADWFAQHVPNSRQRGVMGYIRAGESVPPASPSQLPPARCFPDIGWAILHTDLANPDNNVHFMLKSSPYGSFSHSFADQNAFTLEAYGSPLATSSGYRPWYGSPHHMQYTKQTQAHNSILVNGQGQIAQSLAAKGKIAAFYHGPRWDYIRGDATQAYGQIADPAGGPPATLTRFWRHVLFLRPDIFVIYDELSVAPGGATFTWLLHSYVRMYVDEERRIVTVPAEKAVLNVYFLLPAQDRDFAGLKFELTDQFPVPLDSVVLDEPDNKPNQWHLRVTTMTPRPREHFLTVLQVCRPCQGNAGAAASARSCPAELLPAEGGFALWLPSRRILVLLRAADAPVMKAATTQGIPVEATGQLAALEFAETNEANMAAPPIVEHWLLAEGSRLVVDGRPVYTRAGDLGEASAVSGGSSQ
ncbi:MAG: DUF4962 domain-containing protein [Limnochordales bacterium]|nr:DUF4962 domain-containing protein [Limnochordales bacterium]